MLRSHSSELPDVECPQTSDCSDASDSGISATGICPRSKRGAGHHADDEVHDSGLDRKAFVRLPASYDTSGHAYPVLYLLDGTPASLLEMIAITTRLRNDRNAPEMDLVRAESRAEEQTHQGAVIIGESSALEPTSANSASPRSATGGRPISAWSLRPASSLPRSTAAPSRRPSRSPC